MSEASVVRFYFSFRSPFAAIAFYRLRRSPLFKDVKFELIPLWPENIFGGHMDNPTDSLFKVAYIFSDAARQAEEAGLPSAPFNARTDQFKLPAGMDYSKEKAGLKMPEEPWRITHLAFLYAQGKGKGWAFADAVFSRRFDFDGKGSKNVMDPEVLGKIADRVGLDVVKTVNAHTSGRFDEIHRKMIQQGEADGVFGVPFFVIEHGEDNEVFWGNDRLPFLHKAITHSEALPVISADSLQKIQATRC
jgi:2-hydroxychromene-2-carboxylate isomerase